MRGWYGFGAIASMSIWKVTAAASSPRVGINASSPRPNPPRRGGREAARSEPEAAAADAPPGVSLAIKSLSIAARRHRTVWYGSLHGLRAMGYQLSVEDSKTAGASIRQRPRARS